MINVESITDLLAELDEISPLDLRECSDSLRTKLHELGLPPDLEQLFASCWPQTPDLAMIGGLCIDCTGQIISAANREYFIEHGLCAIGSSVTGDLVCLDLGRWGYPVWFTNHEEFNYPSSPHDLMIEFAPSFEQFLENGLADDLPQDYHDAVDRFGAE